MSKAVRHVQKRFRELAAPEKAAGMAAYMKTEMPFYGVQKPARETVWRELRDIVDCPTRTAYRETVLTFWALPHREEKYTALHLARRFEQHITPGSMPLYKKLVVEGAWWDFVDEVACRLVGQVLLKHRAKIRPTLDQWIDHKDMWLRRTAIISQVTHKEQTDEDQLYRYALRRAHEKEFFIRKAIGWSLRAYAWIDPASVKRFLKKHGDELSPLSYREAAKNLAAV
jgi:3-methyladenine DNA glycosylase AlkD